MQRSKVGTVVRPSKRVEEWETVDDLETAQQRVRYWAEFVTDRGFGERFGFWREPSPSGYKIMLLDRSIPESSPYKSKRK
ncbi:hypothetical protein [Streptomyces parvus]|uniref:Uncharacterized protein n=1 Tax=Streptomyces parvus TaxID=66428 RepID=A0A7K3S185_9ACTN|nr:hypothetical protein [Streptomyces parvus]NEC21188.1 hypothetical protein [Streptomyces parvus]NEE24515.1 hypothetical protein [Streptomyces sp. SID7982]